MTASNQLSLAETLTLLKRLRHLMRDFGGHESALEKDLRLRAENVRREREQDLEQLEAELTAAREAAEIKWREAETTFTASLDRSHSAIARARATGLQHALERVNSVERRRKLELQAHIRDWERVKPAEQQAAAQAYADVGQTLQARRGEVVDLIEKVNKMLAGYPQFLQSPATVDEAADAEEPITFDQQFQTLGNVIEDVREALRRIRRVPHAWLFRILPLPLLSTLVPLAAVVALAAVFVAQAGSAAYIVASVTAVAIAAALCLLYFAGRRKLAPLARPLAEAIGRMMKLHNACLASSRAEYDAHLVTLEEVVEQEMAGTQAAWQTIQLEADDQRLSAEESVEIKHQRVQRKRERLDQRRRERFENAHAESLRQLNQEAEDRRRRMTETHAGATTALAAERETRWRSLVQEWRKEIDPLAATLRASQHAAATDFPDWTVPDWSAWNPPAQFPNAVTFGQAEVVDLAQFSPHQPRDPRLALPEGLHLAAPLAVTFPQPGSLLLETSRKGREQALAALNALVYRLLISSQPGHITFTLFDPVELGQNFAGFMHLADKEKSLVNGRIWTQDRQIEQRLADLNEHMEKVIQMYLRTEHRSLAEYNAQAGDLAEKYRFLVIADFPVGFTEIALNRLLSIAASGAKCGVYTLIHWDRRRQLPQSFVVDELRRNSICLQCQGENFEFVGSGIEGLRLRLDTPPPPDVTIALLHRIGRLSAEAARVELAFANAAPTELERWSLRTDSELRVPIGRTGASRLQYFELGKGTRQHALVAGKTGSGKSNLLNVLITNLALWCSPREVEFYLIDFKKGVEFKCYATQRLPHARVVAIESDREFGLSVLQRVDEELKQRGELFRQRGVQELAAYRRSDGARPLPRTLLIVDEFQEFFVEDDAVSQAAALLLDRLVRQGRAFGIHVILGSQTLGGAYTVSRSTLGQMVVRIALQCNEADAFLIMDDHNSAPRMLSRPGEAIYNDSAGMLEGNSPFQVVFLPDDVRESQLTEVRRLADRDSTAWPGPLVFEGSAPAALRENVLLETLLSAKQFQPAAVPRIWLGAPNSIKGPTEVSFPRQSGSNLLIVGQQEEAQVTLIAAALAALATQYSPQRLSFLLLDATPPGSPHRDFLERMAQALPHRIQLLSGTRMAESLAEVAAEISARQDAEHHDEMPAIFVLVNGIQRFPALRYGDGLDFAFGDEKTAANPAAHLNQIISNGGAVGCHAIIACDTFNNANRFLGRKGLTECTMRVLFQMGASDSASLIDNPVAGSLGLHRAVLYNEQAGYTEIFRPYALPDPTWVRDLSANLTRLHGPRPSTLAAP